MSTITYNPSFLFLTPSVQKIDNQELFDDQCLRKQEAENQQNNQNNFKKESLQSSLDKLNQKIIFLQQTLLLPKEGKEEGYLSEFLSESNQLQDHLLNSKLTQSVVTNIQNWQESVIHELSKVQGHEVTEDSLQNQANLINKAMILLHDLNNQATQKLPLAETLTSRSALLSTSEEKNDHSSTRTLQEDNTAPTTDTNATESSDSMQDINIYVIMLSLALSANTVVTNAINMQTKMNEFLKDMVSDLQNLLSLITTVNKAYKDCQTQILTDHSTDNSGPSFGWEKVSSIGNLNMAQLLAEAPSNTTWAGQVNPNAGGASIALCFYDPTKNAGTPPNDLLAKYVSPDGSGKYFADETTLNKMLTDLGAKLSPFVGGNLATYNPNGFSDVNTIEGLTKSVSSAIDNVQNQSAANISKLNLANQGLNQANSNCITTMSNFLSVMMKLAAV